MGRACGVTAVGRGGRHVGVWQDRGASGMAEVACMMSKTGWRGWQRGWQEVQVRCMKSGRRSVQVALWRG
jgi:hypothetical protein